MLCKICQGSTEELPDKQFNHMYYYCRGCHFVFIEDKHHISYEEERNIYELHQNSLDDQGYVSYLEAYIEEGLCNFVSSGEGLEFGSGPEPVLAELLKRRGYEVDIYDRHYADNHKVWNKKYDFITSTEVVEHFHEPLETLRVMAELLKPGGYLSIMTLFLPENLELFQDWWYRRDLTHIAFFSPQAFKVIGDKLGLEMVYHNDKRIVVFRKNAL